jgi:hypothetical protein
MSYRILRQAVFAFAKFLPNRFVKPLDLFDLSSLPIAFSFSIPVQHGSLSLFDPGLGFLNFQRAFPNFIEYPTLKRMSLEDRFS